MHIDNYAPVIILITAVTGGSMSLVLDLTYSIHSLYHDRIFPSGNQRYQTLLSLVSTCQDLNLHKGNMQRHFAIVGKYIWTLKVSCYRPRTKSPRTIFQSFIGSTGFRLFPFNRATRLAAAVHGLQDILSVQCEVEG